MNGILLEFCIEKFAYSSGESIDLSAVAMMTKRKLSPVGKIGISTMLECVSSCPVKDMDLVYASRYGELERVMKLISQKREENEVSPTGFSFSVHNSTIGLFSLMSNIHSKYNSVSAGNHTLSVGLLTAIMNQTRTLFCFAESVDGYESISMLINSEISKNADKIICKSNIKNLESNNLIDFLEKRSEYYVSSDGLYVLERVK